MDPFHCKKKNKEKKAKEMCEMGSYNYWNIFTVTLRRNVSLRNWTFFSLSKVLWGTQNGSSMASLWKLLKV